MILRSLELSCFGCCRDAVKLDFPTSGVVVITGKNGSGKSTIVDAAIWALYGRLLRGVKGFKSFVCDGTFVRLVFSNPDFVVMRVVNGNKTVVSTEPSRYVRVPRVNSYIASIVGSYRLMTSTRVFHRRLLSRFSQGSDFERKAVIEELLDIDKFGVIADSLKDQRKKCKSELLCLEHDYSLARENVALLRGAYGALVEPSGSRKDLSELLSKQRLLSDELRNVEQSVVDDSLLRCVLDSLSSLDTKVIGLESRKNAVECALSASSDRVCPTCNSSLKGNKEAVKHLKCSLDSICDELAVTMLARDKLLNDKLKAEMDIEPIIEKRNSMLTELRERLMQVSVDLRFQRGINDSWHTYERRKNLCRDKLDSALNFLKEKRSKLETLKRKLERLDMLLYIYGSRGARVRLIASSLVMLSDVATSVVSEISSGRLSKLSVEASDDLTSVNIFAGLQRNIVNYHSLSEGEQSISDFALLKALSSVPGSSARGLPIVYDDVFDALDDDIVDGVSGYIQRESENAQVLILTHKSDVKHLFSNPICYHVWDGRLCE